MIAAFLFCDNKHKKQLIMPMKLTAGKNLELHHLLKHTQLWQKYNQCQAPHNSILLNAILLELIEAGHRLYDLYLTPIETIPVPQDGALHQ